MDVLQKQSAVDEVTLVLVELLVVDHLIGDGVDDSRKSLLLQVEDHSPEIQALAQLEQTVRGVRGGDGK